MKALIFPFLLSVLISFHLPFRPGHQGTADIPATSAVKPVPPDSVEYNGTMQETTDFLSFRNGHQNLYYYPGSDSFLYLYSEISAPEVIAQGERSPLNISLVIDRSGSMSGDKLKYAKEAAKFVVQNLGPKDFVSIITYESGVQVVAAAQPVTNKQHLINLIDNVNTGGSTNLSGGMFEGFTQVQVNKSDEYVNRVLLMSDGLANVGISDSASLVQAAAKKLEETGIGLSTFGVGADFNENLMQSLAEYGGNYYFIGTPDQIPDIFAKELNGLLLVAAQNLKLRIEFPAGVTLNKVFGYRYEQKGNTIEIDYRDIFSLETKAVLIRFKADPQSNADLLFRETATFVLASDGSNRELKTETRLKFLGEPALYHRSYNKTVLQQIVLFESNAILEEAMGQVDGRDYQGARERMNSGRQELKRYRAITPDNQELHVQDSLYNNYEDQIEEVEKMKEEERKFYQKDNKMRNYEMRKKK